MTMATKPSAPVDPRWRAVLMRDASDPTGNSIFASFQNAGLKLEPKKLPLDFIVVDHADKVPTEN